MIYVDVCLSHTHNCFNVQIYLLRTCIMWLSLGTITTGAQVHSLVRELRSHGVAKKKKKK